MNLHFFLCQIRFLLSSSAGWSLEVNRKNMLFFFSICKTIIHFIIYIINTICCCCCLSSRFWHADCGHRTNKVRAPEKWFVLCATCDLICTLHTYWILNAFDPKCILNQLKAGLLFIFFNLSGRRINVGTPYFNTLQTQNVFNPKKKRNSKPFCVFFVCCCYLMV